MNDWFDAADALLKLAGYRNAMKSEMHVRASESAVSPEATDEVRFMLQQVQWEWMQERKKMGL